MRPLFTILFSFVLLLPSCASTRSNPFLSQVADADLPKKELKSLNKKASKLWSSRNDESSLKEFILVQQRIAESKSHDQNDLVLMARSEYLLGEYFTESEKEKIRAFETSANWAEKALTFNPKFKDALIKQKLPAELALDTLNKGDTEALYWFAVSLGKWAQRKGISTTLKYKDRIKKMIDRVAALNPNYFYGAVNRYYGAFYALLPGYNEDDLVLSRRHFERAIKQAPDYFANHVFFAEYYAKKVDDQSLFRKHLEGVIKGNPNHPKEYAAEQMLEQVRARKLLEGKAP